jgi:transketolase
MGPDETAVSGRAIVEAPFGKALAELGRSQPEIVGLTADLGKYTDILPFRDAYRQRFFNVGMAKQNLVAVAAGLARTGKIPIRHDLWRLRHASRLRFHRHRLRPQRHQWEDHRGLPGLTTAGGTHQAIEDLALMRMIPRPRGD